MSIFDILVFLAIIVILHLIKAKYNNFMFFCKGAILYYLPQESKPFKPKPNSNEHVLSYINLEYQYCKQLPLVSDYDRITLILGSIVIFIIIKLALVVSIGAWIFSPSSFIFFVIFLTFVYSIKIGLNIFWISSYNIKICIAISIGINLLYFLLYVGLNNIGVYDSRIVMDTIDFRKHLSIVLGTNANFFNHFFALGFVLLINVILTLVVIPTVIKFGNWYTRTLKQSFYGEFQQANQDQINIKKRSKRVIKFLNTYLFLYLLLIVSSHRFFQQFLNTIWIDTIRAVLLTITISINLYMLKYSIQFNNSFALTSIKEYYQNQDSTERAALRKKVAQYIYFMWYYIFQFAFRVIVPLFIFTLIIDAKYLSPPNQSYTTQITDFNSESVQMSAIECQINTDTIKIIQSIYQCGKDTLKQTNKHLFSNGVIMLEQDPTSLHKIQARIALFGLVWKPLILQLIQLLFWYSNSTIYFLTTVYIVFLRKTVYDI